MLNALRKQLADFLPDRQLWIGALAFVLLLSALGLLAQFQISYALFEQVEKLSHSLREQRLMALAGYCWGAILIIGYLSRWHWVKDSLSWLGAIGLYLVTVSLSIMTTGVNNPKVTEKLFFKPEWLNWSIMPSLLLLIGLGWGLGRLTNWSKGFGKYLPESSVSLASAGLLGLAVVVSPPVLALYKSPLLAAIDQDQNLLFWTRLWSLALPWYGLVTGLLWSAIRMFRGSFDNRTTLGAAITTSFMVALVLSYRLQLGYQTGVELLGRYIFTGAVTYQLVFFTLAFLSVYLMTNRYLLSTLLVSSFAVIVALVNSLKMTMRAEPLLITDFVWLKELGLLLSFVEKGLIYKVFAGLVLVLLAYFFLKPRILRGKVVKSTGLRALALAGMAVFAASVFTIFAKEKDNKIAKGIPVLSRLNNEHEVNWLGFATNASYKSLAYVWTKQLTKQVMDKPEDYSSERVRAIYEKYRTQAEEINAERPNELTDQTVIFVLSESLANPAYVPTVELSEPVLPNIEAVKGKTTSGLMTTDFYGGGTANMEFQSLTGLPFSNFSSSVSIAYTEVVPKMDHVPAISHQFEPENRIALHPAGAANYNRFNIYKGLGFETFIAKEGGTATFENPASVGVSISDQTVYDTLLSQINPEQSQFFSVITMQNHAPWVVGDPEKIVAKGPSFTPEQNSNLTHYARLLYHTDQATQKFLTQLEAIDKSITVVFYGDHLPGLYPKEVFASKPESQYQTDYFIWNNKKKNPQLSYPLIGSSDFIAALLEHTGSKVTPYQALLTSYLKEVVNQKQALSDEQLAIAEDLKLIQYDLTVGRSYLLQHEDFFERKD